MYANLDIKRCLYSKGYHRKNLISKDNTFYLLNDRNHNCDKELVISLETLAMLNKLSIFDLIYATEKDRKFNDETQSYLDEIQAHEMLKSKEEDGCDLSDSEQLMLNIYNQLEMKTPNDIRKISDNLQIALLKEGICPVEKNVLILLNRMTQLSNMESISKLAKQIGTDFNLYVDFSLDETMLNYLHTKRVFFPIVSNYPTSHNAIIINNDVLDSLSTEELRQMRLYKKTDKYIVIEGYDSESSVFGAGIESKKFKEQFVSIYRNAQKRSVKDGISFDDAVKHIMKESVVQKAKALGINEEDIIVTDIAEQGNISYESIAKNYAQTHISAKNLDATINAIVDTVFDDPEEQIKAKKILYDYYNYNIRIISGERINKLLKLMHEKILQAAGILQDKNVEDRIYYVTPTDKDDLYTNATKSDEYITNLYARVNNIPSDKILDKNQWRQEKSKDNIYVMLDDFSGTGGTMNYMHLHSSGNFKNMNVIYAPLLATEDAQKYITEKLISSNPLHKLIVADERIIPSLDTYLKTLTDEDAEILLKILGTEGEPPYVQDDYMIENTDNYHINTAVVMPYMAPDNNNSLTATFIMKHFIPQGAGVKNMGRGGMFKKIEEKIAQHTSA